jgi:hypothetical protein
VKATAFRIVAAAHHPKIEAGLALASASLFVLTLAWPDWIERAFGVDPDRHSGVLEWALAFGLFALTCAFAALARTSHRRLGTAETRS